MEGKLRIAPSFFMMGALAVLMLPLRWVMGMVLAAMAHEIFHCVAVRLSGGQVLALSLGALGARIETTPMYCHKEAFCALAGPVGSFSLLLIAERFPEAALCGLIQGAYNLLPLYPLDGGRFLRCLLPDSACAGIRVFALVILTGTGLWLITISPEIGIILLLSVWIGDIQRKISCKAAR